MVMFKKSFWSRWLMLLTILVTARLLLIPSMLDAKPCPTCRIAVNTLSDASTSGDGLCSLREAIDNANSPGTDTTGGDCAIGTGQDTIKFTLSGTITIGSTLPPIANPSGDTMTIDGSGQSITIAGDDTSQVFIVSPGATITLNNLTVAHGRALVGGGVFTGGTLTV